MEGMLPLAGLLAASGSFLYMHRLNRKKALEGQRNDGFQDLVNPAVVDALGPEHSQYVRDGASRFNPIMNLINPARNPLLPPNFTASDVNSSIKKIQSALGTATATPDNPSVSIRPSDVSNIALNTGGGGTGFQSIAKCETVKTLDCNAFDDDSFAFNCGMCHEGGVNSGANKIIGGLFVLEDDLADAVASAKRMGSKRPNYTPSVGKCNPGRFTVSKAQCERLKKQMECEAKQNYDVPGCSQCFQDGIFKYLDSDLQISDAALILVGTGTLKITRVGGTFNETKELSTSQAVKITIPKFNEGDVLQLEITGASPSLAGYLVGTTVSGEFRLDINRLIQTDTVTNSKPALSGFLTIAGENYTLMRPGRDRASAKFNLQNVFTFINSSESEAAECATAPYVKTQKSAEFLESGACYKKGNRPGAYSMDCLKEIFISSGCEGAGSGYPDTPSKMQSLMVDSKTGKALSIGDIAAKVYAASLSAYTGLDSKGTTLTISEWDVASRFCTGKSITSPCDMDNKSSGPLSSKCLDYIWKNQGAIDNLPGGLGPTYTNTSSTTSLTQNNNRFCTSNGTMAPINAQGQLNQAAFTAAQAKGGVVAVKEFYNTIHQKANDNTLDDSARKDAIQQCYGINLDPLPENTVVGTLLASALSNKCTSVPTINGPIPSNRIANVIVTSSWKYTFTIRPTGTDPNWANIFHVTYNNTNSEGVGSRAPGLWFIPGQTRLHLVVNSKRTLQWIIDSTQALPLNQDTNVSVECKDRKITLSMSGAVNETLTGTLDDEPYVGPALLYASDPFYPGFKGTMTNFKYCFNTTNTSVLDNRAGSTKTSFKVQNYNPINWNSYRPVNVLGAYGIGPWGTWWASGFPGTQATKWIWNTANAANDEPSWSFKPFLTKYTNPTSTSINATLHVAVDNRGTLSVNDINISNSFEGYRAWTFQLPPGESKIEINGANSGGPAGLIVLCKDSSGNTLFVSDSTWVTTG
jgi:hypothetical protein